jgi:hypothetical protein
MLPALLSRRTLSAGLVGVAAVGALATGCGSADGTKVISGTIRGADHKLVDALIGFDVRDAAGNRINLGGTGYSAMVRVNHCVKASGAFNPQTCRTGKITGYSWALRVPASAASVFIEAYPKSPTPTDFLVGYRGYTGVAAGTTNTSTYATAYRRSLPIGPAGLGGVSIVLPKTCAAGGTTGSLVGHISGWPRGVVGHINAWSLAPDQPTMGFATGTVAGNGTYRINGLQSGQRYGVIAGGGGFSRNLVDYRRATSNDTLIPGRCAVKTFNF